MSWLVFFLGLCLSGAGGYGLYASIDLVPTEIGLLYATCGSIAVAGGIITLAIGALIRRVDALRAPLAAAVAHTASIGQASALSEALRAVDENDYPPPPPHEAEVFGEPGSGEAAGALQPAAPDGPTTLVGRYSAGGASYKIFSDGSIEADTDQGAFRFASMGEFKAFIAAKRPADAILDAQADELKR